MLSYILKYGCSEHLEYFIKRRVDRACTTKIKKFGGRENLTTTIEPPDFRSRRLIIGSFEYERVPVGSPGSLADVDGNSHMHVRK
jgi:hypothetical protein